MDIPTPSFVVDESAVTRNMGVLAEVKRRTGCRVLLALKAFSMFELFPLMRKTLDGCCASSVHEARLGREKFGGEVHAFAAAFSETEMRELAGLVDHITLNSLAQLELFRKTQEEFFSQERMSGPTSHVPRPASRVTIGLRINPEHSEGAVEIYDPCAPKSRLGIRSEELGQGGADIPVCVRRQECLRHLNVTGLHCHNLCEQGAEPFARTVGAIERKFGTLLDRISWMNFGGGHHITRGGYDLDLLCGTINAFRARHPNIRTVYLEPGEACVLDAGTLVATVLDVVENGMPIAILDASCACHTPDVMEMPYRPRVEVLKFESSKVLKLRGGAPGEGAYTVRLAGASCLAGDVFGDWSFDAPLRTGDRVVFEDMAHYTMVKTNTFNGIRLPSIMVRETGGGLKLVRAFGYEDFVGRLS